MKRKSLARCKYLFSYLKYKSQYVLETWPVTDTYYLTHNMKLAYIWDLVGYRYIFFYSKYEALDVSETWLVAITYFLTQNIKASIYLRLGRLQIPIFLAEIWSLAYTKDLASCQYLFSHPQYEVGHVFEASLVIGACFFTQNMKPGIYLRPSRLHVPIFLPKIWSRVCNKNLASCKYLFFHLKYEAQGVSTMITYLSNKNMRGGGLAGYRYLFFHLKN